MAGIIEGVCDGAGMTAKVTAHNNSEGGGGGGGGKGGSGSGGRGGEGEMWPGKTVFLIRFEEGVGEREGIVVAMEGR